ncbi:hypothetical protein QFZ82_002131 [Streptomyces sp. V4I23]|nr:ABC transporter [Streptomyces sp. V4I23]MDQ1007646.1 hypothetical protein [Streptomyces sp. V4I23]
MTALFGYQAALLLRSQRWLPPVLLYGITLTVGVQGGRPVPDALGWTAAALLPVTAWLVRVCATQEPPAARAVTAAAAGPPRAHLSALLAAVAWAGAIGAVATGVVALISDARSADHRAVVPLLPAVAAGLLACAVSVLVGAAVGALCTRPVLHPARAARARLVAAGHRDGGAAGPGDHRLTRPARGERPRHRLADGDGPPAGARPAGRGAARGRCGRDHLPAVLPAGC